MTAEAAETVSPVITAIGQILGVVVVIAGGALFNHWKGGKRDQGAKQREEARERSLDERLSTVVDKIDARVEKRLTHFQERFDDKLDAMDRGIAEVKAICVGPDGENGLRADIREVKARVIGLEDRERERLEPRDVGRLDRRAAS